MSIKDKYVENVCPSCGNSARLQKFQYLYMYRLLLCKPCELRWRSQLNVDNPEGIISTRKEDEIIAERVKVVESKLNMR